MDSAIKIAAVYILLLMSVSATKFHVTSIPTFTDTLPTTFTGYLPIGNGTRYFYMFVQNPDPNKPVVLWLNGGPGCSSMVGAFLEIGPFTLVNGSLQNNPYAWNNAAHVLFIDNPVGAGFSYGPDPSQYPSTALQSAKDLYAALQIFFAPDHFPQFAQNPFYIFGESYGGKYTLALATEISNAGVKIPLKGFALGNAWVNPDIQERSYGKVAYGFGLSDYRSFVEINADDQNCHQLIMDHKFEEADVQACTPMWDRVTGDGGGFNPYDFRLIGPYQMLNQLITFMRRADVNNALGIESPSSKYVQCSNLLWKKFLVEFQASYTDMLPPLLESNVYRALVYNGQFDLRCDTLGSSEWLRLMEWNGRAGFNYADQQVFYDSNNKTMGIFKSYKNLTQLVLYNAGHMAPYNQGLASLDMMKRFIDTQGNGGSLCRPTDSQCLNYQVTCPNQCSKHGECQADGKCLCYEGFSTEDCSLAKHDILFGTLTTYDGYIFGRSMHIYQLFIGEHGVGYFDIKVTMKKTTLQGILYLYMHGATSFVTPDASDTDILREQFNFHNLEDVNYKQMIVNELPRANMSHLTLVVYNMVDTESEYEISIVSNVSGAKFSGTWIASLLLLIGTGIVMVVLFVWLLVQYINDQRYLANIKYETEHDTLVDDENTTELVDTPVH